MFHGPDDFDEPGERYWLDELVKFLGAFGVIILLAAITSAAAHSARQSNVGCIYSPASVGPFRPSSGPASERRCAKLSFEPDFSH